MSMKSKDTRYYYVNKTCFLFKRKIFTGKNTDFYIEFRRNNRRLRDSETVSTNFSPRPPLPSTF